MLCHNDSMMQAAHLSIARCDPYHPDAVRLLAALSAELEAITGSSGQASFDLADVSDPRACFLVARDGHGAAVGCGALRPLAPELAEIKRMYAVPGLGDAADGGTVQRSTGGGVGSAVLARLEAEARLLGYRTLWLETRRINARAVAFYTARGYVQRPNYGRYAGNALAVCFEKQLTPA